MGCGCGGGRRRSVNPARRSTTTITPQSSQLRPARAVQPTVQNLSATPAPGDRQEIERKRRIQISLRKRNETK